MRSAPLLIPSLALLCLLPVTAARADLPTPTEFRPDPASVQRYGPAYRYPQAGWIVLHIEGQPYERGYQHGRLLAPEIAAHLRCFAAVQNPKAPSDGWRTTRTLTNALFVRRYDQEYLEEMKGIADGATAAGARFDNRPIDLVDVVALNAWPEIDTLGSALEATPNGLEGVRFPNGQPRVMPDPKPMRCSAFAATGPATKDGKVVFGHITMFSLYPAGFYNVWLDVKPAKGHRVLMQTYPAGIQSGLDYYLNDAGIVVCETTIAQTRFAVEGMALASRIRQALQYADTIDRAVEILREGNNGLYTNEWLLADVKTNEIAMFELGTRKSKLYRSGKNEWFGGTEGFYWGCNNTKDLDVRLETVASLNGRPANGVFCPSDRDKTWLRLYDQYKGRIDAEFGKVAFTTPPVAAYHSLDAKFTTTDLAKDLKTWALFGPPLGRTWQPTQDERQRYPEIKPLVSNPWTVLHTTPPAKTPETGSVAADLRERTDSFRDTFARQEEDRPLRSVPAWHGTLLPATDADTWLATAFADYERVVAAENARRERRKKDQTADVGLATMDRERQAAELYGRRATYSAAVRAGRDVPLEQTRAELRQSEWYREAAGKGVLVLHELRRLLGDGVFQEAMDSFGRDHAGKPVTAAQFQDHVEKAAGRPLRGFFDYWLKQPGLPQLQLEGVNSTADGHKHRVEGNVSVASPAREAVGAVDVTVETAKGEETKAVRLNAGSVHFVIETDDTPRRVVVDKYDQTAKANGGVFTVLSFYPEVDQTLIVYGTRDEVPTNREAAEALQRAIIERGSNQTVPIKADKDVTDADLRGHHLLLVGRPDSNSVVERVRENLPVRFGPRSFSVRQETFAHADSAVLAAADNPLNKRYSVVVIAGLGAEATLRTAPALVNRTQRATEVVVLPHQGRPRTLVVPAAELVHELGNGSDKRVQGGE